MIVFPQGHVPPLLDVFHVGFGPDAFISKPWHTAYTGTNLYGLKFLCPSRTPAKAEQMRQNLRLPPEHCSHDFTALLRTAFADKGNANTVVCITTETGAHCLNIVDALAAGAKYLIVDKPLVRTMDELRTVQTAVDNTGAQLCLTYNHTFNAPVHQIRHLAKTVGVRHVRSWFKQGWLNSNLKGLRQFDWRTDDPLCGPLDIWSHAENLASFATDQAMTSVQGVRLGNPGGHGKGDIYTSGTCTAQFANGVSGEVSFHQALPGHLDNIGVCVSLTDGRHVMWQLEWGVDNLWVTKWHDADVDNPQNWQRLMRGGEGFEQGINATFDETPPGHHHGWSSLWRYLFTAYAGAVYKHRKIDLGFPQGQCPRIFDLPVPGLLDAEQTTRFIHAAVRSFKNSGDKVELATIA